MVAVLIAVTAGVAGAQMTKDRGEKKAANKSNTSHTTQHQATQCKNPAMSE